MNKTQLVEEIAGKTEQASNHDPGRVEEIAQVGDREADLRDDEALPESRVTGAADDAAGFVYSSRRGWGPAASARKLVGP